MRNEFKIKLLCETHGTELQLSEGNYDKKVGANSAFEQNFTISVVPCSDCLSEYHSLKWAIKNSINETKELKEIIKD